MRTATITAAAALAVVLAGCGSDPEPAAAPSPTTAAASAAPASSSAAGPDAYAQRSCQKNTASQDGDLNLDVLAEVAYEAQQSSTEQIRFAGAMLDDRVKMAEAAQGADDEAAMEANAVASSFDFMGACATVGLVY